MLVAVPLGGFREDAIDVLSIVVGDAQAQNFVSGLERHIRAEAKRGAEQAAPTIEARVRKAAKDAVKPYVIASLIIGGLGAVVGGWALVRSFSRHRR